MFTLEKRPSGWHVATPEGVTIGVCASQSECYATIATLRAFTTGRVGATVELVVKPTQFCRVCTRGISKSRSRPKGVLHAATHELCSTCEKVVRKARTAVVRRTSEGAAVVSGGRTLEVLPTMEAAYNWVTKLVAS